MADSSDDKNNWREKYLDALDTQEAQEKHFITQQELLHRALVRVSLAADGQDEALDQMMAQLREQIRSTTHSTELAPLLARLEKTALDFEIHRDKNAFDIQQALSDTLIPLQRLKLSKSTKKDINQFLAQLPQRSKKIRLYPALLQQLASLQQQALQEQAQPSTTLWEKLLGSKKNPTPDQHTASYAALELSGESPDELPVNLPNEPLDDGLDARAHDISEHTDHPQAAGDGTFISEAFSNEIVQVLSEFLISLENEDAIKEKVTAMRHKVERGLDAKALIPTLENVRDLVMEAYLAANQAFVNYLNNVNQELVEIYSLLGGAVQTSAHEREASRQLQVNMMREMQNLESSAANATDINQLKNQVSSQLGNIRQVIDHYQHTDHAQTNLAQQLETLGAKIKTMEMEAEKNRTTLETHRHKALHDPLTELPNREAYNERAKIEMLRWQRYGRPLTIAIFDIDHFKNINDTYGHQAGDRVLKVIGRSIAKRLREVDFFCRYGGEEFVALLPETNSDAALVVLDKIRNGIANAAFNYKGNPLEITLSIGITTFKSDDKLKDAFERADQALYIAKSSGRNCSRAE